MNLVRAQLSSLLVALAACGPSVAGTASEESSSANDDGADPSAGEAGAANPYGECHPNGTVGALPCTGSFGTNGDATSCAACACHPHCEADADCPTAPSGGTGAAACVEGRCIILCDDDDSCPNGMRCRDWNDGERSICMEPLTDPLACAATSDWPDPCPAIADRESCEAFSSPGGGYACGWVTQKLYSLPADDCVPVETTEHCVLTDQRDHNEPECGLATKGGYCNDLDVRVAFEDLGPGTVRLTTLRGCDRLPVAGFPNEWGLCDFSGEIPIPIICDCACEGA